MSNIATLHTQEAARQSTAVRLADAEGIEPGDKVGNLIYGSSDTFSVLNVYKRVTMSWTRGRVNFVSRCADVCVVGDDFYESPGLSSTSTTAWGQG